MIYPDNFERKIGFSDIRTMLKGRCMSALGTEWVDNHVSFSSDYDEVKEWLSQATEFGQMMEIEEEVYEEQFFDVRQPLMRIRPERTYMEELELFDLKRSLQTVVSLTTFLYKHSNAEENKVEKEAVTYPALSRMADEIDLYGISAFPTIIKRIDTVLNKYGKVKDTASPDLLTIRHTMEVTLRSISHSLRSIISEAQQEGYIDRDVSPTLRDGRLVIPVAPSLKRKIKGIIHDESATGKTVFIEPAVVVDANNKIRELKAAERREIIRILQILSSEIRPHIPAMMQSMQFLGHIDYLRALASFSSQFECKVPDLDKSPRIDWIEARHPLLQQSLERHGRKMVPLNITLRTPARMLLISGPNAGGKSVCLKTIGLLQYMIQCGMPIPMREESRVGIFDDIFIDIGDEQSIEDDLSTYSSHLLNMKQMMKHACKRSLLLIDEFGGGTEPQIGGAIAEAILQRFVDSGVFGIITTHYQNLKHFAENTDTVVNGAMLYDRAEMQPLFVLQVGNPGSSFAIEIARKIGIPQDVIEYASNLVGKDYVMSDKYLQDIVRDKLYWENKRRNIHNREKQLEDTITKYEEELTTLSKQRKDVLTDAREQAKQLLRESNARIENTIREIRETQAEKERTREIRRELQDFKTQVSEEKSEAEDPITRKMEKIRRRQERRRENKNNNKPREEGGLPVFNKSFLKNTESIQSLPEYEVGSYVRLLGQNTVGRIEEINDKEARVLFGMMRTTVKLSRLEPAKKPEEDNSVRISTFISRETRDAMHERKLHFRPDIDLRGMRAEEALTTVAYFIDDAIQFEQSRVRILHGTGTGALREVVRSYVSSVVGVKSYHDEHIQFGGAGITVVEFE